MAVYVTSDAHGHVRVLDEALGKASPGADDEVYVVGDMVDRGPDPLGVVELVRSLDGAHALMGNHEQLMLAALAHTGAPTDGTFDLSGFDTEAFLDWSCWMQNGGGATSAQLEGLSQDEFERFATWARALPIHATCEVADRTYLIVHAGLNPHVSARWRDAHPEADVSDPKTLEELVAAQDEEDLLWIRDEFWASPTGLVDAEGRGPVVVAGHTPSPYLEMWFDEPVPCVTADGHGTIVELGACAETGGVADRIDIDCAAAAGPGIGRVGVLRLDDRATWFAEVREGQ